MEIEYCYIYVDSIEELDIKMNKKGQEGFRTSPSQPEIRGYDGIYILMERVTEEKI